MNSEIVIWSYGLTQGYQLHQSLLLRFFKSGFDNVLQKLSGLQCKSLFVNVLQQGGWTTPCSFSFPTLRDTQGWYLTMFSHPDRPFKSSRLGGGPVTALIPLSLLEFGSKGFEPGTWTRACQLFWANKKSYVIVELFMTPI